MPERRDRFVGDTPLSLIQAFRLISSMEVLVVKPVGRKGSRQSLRIFEDRDAFILSRFTCHRPL